MRYHRIFIKYDCITLVPVKMKAAVICYSATGNTEKMAEKMVELLRSEEIETELISIERGEERSYEENVEEAKQEKKVKIEPVKTDLSDFDLVVLGTPVWCGKPATPVNTYLSECEGSNDVEMILFVTHGGGGPGRTFEIMKTELEHKGGKVKDTFSIYFEEIDDSDVKKDMESVLSRWIR